MEHFFYVARDPEFTPLAALGIALGPGLGGTASCKMALILPRQPSSPILHEVTGLQGTEGLLHQLALKQAGYKARARQVPFAGSDFRAAPWSTLVRWAIVGNVTREALAAVAEHLGNVGDFGWLGRPAAQA